MPRSNIQDILRVMNEINKLDKKGRLAILKDLLAQKLDIPKDTKPVTYTKEAGE